MRVRVTNGLEEDTAVHWHGLRLENAMDGVPYLTQGPIPPGESFDYDFRLPDAGPIGTTRTIAVTSRSHAVFWDR